MAEERKSLAGDLAGAVRSALVGVGGTSPADRLSVLEDEHRLLSDRRRRLHERIDLLEGFDALKPDVVALLEKYKSSEREISWRRRDLYREIGDLRLEQARLGLGI